MTDRDVVTYELKLTEPMPSWRMDARLDDVAEENREAELGPFGPDRHQPFKPTDAGITDTEIDPNGVIETVPVGENDWVLRPRPFMECFSADAEHRSYNIPVEFSFDGGSSWHEVNVTIRNLADQAGIYIEEPDLCRIQPPGFDDPLADQPYYWKSLIQGLMRLRVTAVIEGDQRVVPNLDASRFRPPSQYGTTRLFDVSTRFHSNRRDGANSQFRPGQEKAAPSETVETGDDILALQTHAETILEVCTSRQQPSVLIVPWLTTDYQVGHAIRSITGMGVIFWTHADSGGRRHPDVVAVKYTPADTSIVLEDFRLLNQLKRSTIEAAVHG